MTNVTDADRSMAAHVFMALDSDQLDTFSLQMFFANHRTTAEQAGYDRAIAEVVAWLRGIGFGDEDQNRAKFEIMKAIEAGEHLK